MIKLASIILLLVGELVNAWSRQENSGPASYSAPVSGQMVAITPTFAINHLDLKPGSRFRNKQGDACEILLTGTLACWRADGAGYGVPGKSTFPGPVPDGRNDVKVFKTQEGYVCELAGGLYLNCESRDQETGQFSGGFSSRCDQNPEFCKKTLESQIKPKANGGGVIIFWPSAGNSVERGNLAKNESDQMTGSIPPAPPSPTMGGGKNVDEPTSKTPLSLEGRLPSGQEFLSKLTEKELREGNARMGELLRAGRVGAGHPAAILARLRLSIWYWIARRVSRNYVIRRLPLKYYQRDGIFEKPQKRLQEIVLFAQVGIPSLLRDVTIGEECLGLAPGTTPVRHAEMIAQCGRLPFGERRIFQF